MYWILYLWKVRIYDQLLKKIQKWGSTMSESEGASSASEGLKRNVEESIVVLSQYRQQCSDIRHKLMDVINKKIGSADFVPQVNTVIASQGRRKSNKVCSILNYLTHTLLLYVFNVVLNDYRLKIECPDIIVTSMLCR